VKFFRMIFWTVPVSLAMWAGIFWCIAVLVGCVPTVVREGATVRVSGYLDQHTADDLAAMLAPGDVVVLASNGGLVLAGVEMAETIRYVGADTRVDDHCMSACVMPYAAGAHRSVDPGAHIGVHRTTGGADVDIAVAGLLRSYGTPDPVVAAMLATSNASMTWVRGW